MGFGAAHEGMQRPRQRLGGPPFYAAEPRAPLPHRATLYVCEEYHHCFGSAGEQQGLIPLFDCSFMRQRRELPEEQTLEFKLFGDLVQFVDTWTNDNLAELHRDIEKAQ